MSYFLYIWNSENLNKWILKITDNALNICYITSFYSLQIGFLSTPLSKVWYRCAFLLTEPKKINIDVINVARYWVILIASVHDNIDSKFETNHWSYAWLNISIALSIFGEILSLYNLRYLTESDPSVFTLNVNGGFFFNSFCLIFLIAITRPDVFNARKCNVWSTKNFKLSFLSD